MSLIRDSSLYAGTTTDTAISADEESVGRGDVFLRVFGVVNVNSEGNGFRGGTWMYCNKRTS
jgi:hypothetical protein